MLQLPAGNVGLTGDTFDFRISSSTCGNTLDPGRRCAIGTVFTGMAPGQDSAAIRFVDNAPGSLQSVQLTAQGVAITIGLSASNASFGSVIVGGSATQHLIVTNTGPNVVTFGDVQITPGPAASDFTQATSCTSLAPGAACEIDVTFAPTQIGDRAAALQIADNAAGNPQSVALAGTGVVETALSVTPSLLDFGSAALAGPAAHRAVTVTNTGGAPVTVTSARVAYTDIPIPTFIHTVAGGGPQSADGMPATDADLAGVFDVALDAAGNMFFVDQLHHRVRRIDAVTGLVTTIAGNGSPGYAGDGRQATNAMLNEPSAVAIDRSNNVYISDSANHVIRRVDPADVITTFAGNGIPAYSGDGGPATAAALHVPRGLFVDATGALWVADSLNHVIRRVGADGVIATMVGTGVQGAGGQNGPVTLNAPGGVVVDVAGTIYVADTGNSRVLQIDPTGVTPLRVVTDLGNVSAPPLGQPSALALDAFGRVFIADTSNNRIALLGALGPGVFAGSALQGGFVDDTPALNGRLLRPRGLAVDVAGNVFVADEGNGRIRRVATTLSGDFTPDFAVDTTACSTALLPGASCDLDVAFLPMQANTRLAQLIVGDNSGGPSHDVTLVGRGTTPIAYVPGSSHLPFTTSIGSTISQVVPLFNTGNAPLHVAGVSLSGDGNAWAVTTDCNAPIAMGSVCHTPVTFSPNAVASFGGTLQIDHDGMLSPLILHLDGTGTVAPSSTTIASVPANRSVFGQPVTLSMAVTSPYTVPSGTLSLLDGATRLALALPLDANGHASYATSALGAGDHGFTIIYGGDAVHAGSFARLVFGVDPQATATTVVASGATSIYGQAITLTATVRSPTNGALSGAVQFFDGATAIGSAAVVAGRAVTSPSTLAVGAHTITAVYGAIRTRSRAYRQRSPRRCRRRAASRRSR